MIDWEKISKEEHQLMSMIADRALRELKELGVTHMDKLTIVMDLAATHLDCPLRLAELLETDSSNFIHDIAGINRHMDRETGKLIACFVPRYAK